MEPENPTVEALKETSLRLAQTNVRLDQLRDETSARFDEINFRIEQLRDELSREIVESGIRTATAITALAGNVGELVKFLKQNRVLKSRLPDA